MVVYERPIRFDEVDSARVVFFARYANFSHEAIENFFGDLSGGYPGLVNVRRIGLPIVHFDANFRAPLRYGDRLRIHTSCLKVGTTSATFAHEMHNGFSGELCVTVRQTVVTVDLDSFRPCPMPHDVRARLAAHT